jgi:hypothetical protein
MTGTGLRFVLSFEKDIETCEIGKIPTSAALGIRLAYDTTCHKYLLARYPTS